MAAHLTDIADIRQGLAFRSKVEHQPAGSIRVVQAKNLGEDGRVELGDIVRVSAVKFSPEQRLRSGDVLLQARGVNYPAALVAADLGEAVAAAPLYVIRPKVEQLDAEYLVLYLTYPVVQARLRSRATGTYVPQLPRAEIDGIRIHLPSLDDQRRLVALGRLAYRERQLTGVLIERRNEILWAAMKEAADEKTQGRGNAPGP